MITIPNLMIPVVGNVRTKDEQSFLRDQIEELEASLFRSDSSALEKIMRTRLPKEIASALRGIIARPEFSDNPKALRTFFRELQHTLDNLPLVRLNIAFQPSEELIARLHDWTLKNIGVGVVLDIGYDSSIIGGARIIFQGKYKEMTLSPMITDALEKEKTIILGMINK